ncbi:hypothetical protein HW532_03350 [Kaustia mangrovi]|uniref:Uncharacterized protein n=1 Tax=Kaustia mangrovi TaxID=2593653 RepID=A0A7S8HAV5_9HYPH|nr:hypothetical protein [Kaustia mangrovi]QPC41834.1 hypothetical protein HW532_03350 [Kaustia mangrovi]
MTAQTYYLVTTAILAVALFFPTARIIWVLSVRRLERRGGVRLDERERQGQLRRARFIAAFLAVALAALFNYHLVFGSSAPGQA